MVKARGLLAEEGGYRIWHDYEQAMLAWSGGNLPIGDHYGDPTCALINIAGAWCMTGGEGLVVCVFDAGMPSGSRRSDARMRTHELWRRLNPPPAAKCWFVESISLATADSVRVATDPSSDYAGLYEVNVRTMDWRRD